MSANLTIDDLKKQDKNLADEVLKHHPRFASHADELNLFIGQADSLINDIERLLVEVTSLEEYEWLRETALKWQAIYSTIFNVPRNVQIPPPAKDLKSPPSVILDEQELNKRLAQKAYRLSKTRKVRKLLKEAEALQKGIHSTTEEMRMDWHHAQIEFASEVLDGVVHFVRHLAASSYPRLQQVWLREAKLLKAYCIWEGREGNQWNEKGDYFQACDQIRQMLVARDLKKISLNDFSEAKAYLETNYLNEAGKLDPVKAKSLKDTRAYQVWVSGGESNPPAYNYEIAETYLQLFYENIIPAVTKNDQEKILLVLKAFNYCCSLGYRYRIINCFEVALAIYFLDPEIIEELWQKTEDWEKAKGCSAPTSWTTSVAVSPSWPPYFVIPAECVGKFEGQGQKISFRGVMTGLQKEALLARLNLPEHTAAIEALFEQSRLLRKDYTL